jgi:hypothetical protein
MSNKTIYKRLALVAVTALGAGVLSVAPANAANNTAVGSAANADTETAVLNVATVASITGAAVISTTAEATSSANNKSLGLLANSTTQTTSSLTSTATMRSDGEIAFYTKASATAEIGTTIEVSGGTISQTGVSDTDGSTGVPAKNINASKTVAVFGQDASADNIIAFAVTPNAGVTSMTVSMYHSGALATANDAAMITALANIQSGSVSKGTLKQRYLVTVASTSLSGIYSAADSYFAGASSSTADNQTTNVDADNSLSIDNGASPAAFININLNDAYGVSLDGKGALIITGTNGAGIGYKADGSATVAASEFNLTQVSSTSAAGKITVVKPAARANKSFSTTVSISWNGVVVATKSVTFKGEVASVTASAPKIGALNSSSNTSAFKVAYADDAGNALYPTITNTSVVSSTTNSIVTGASIGTIGSSAELALGTLVCANVTTGGTANLQLEHVNPLSGTVIKSNVWTATCAGNADTYTASFDKASYTPGSLATLTITFKDAKGQLANAYDLVGNGALITIAGGPSETAVTIPAATDKPDSGVGTKTYQFVVGTTEGDFAAVVTVADVNANGVAKAQTASYSVKSAAGTVTNAEVLKSIVSLIASINKQIQALQKLILRR